MKRSKINVVFLVIILLLLLTGCLYPKQNLSQHQQSNEEQLETVQEAVDAYTDYYKGLVPIKTKDSSTSVYERYLIDFNQLLDEGYLNNIPGTAFENGGVYQYALYEPETKPQVKLIDLRMTEKLRSVNVQLDLYRSKHIYPPFGKSIAKNVYHLDYEKLGLKEEPYVMSPYSNEKLPIVISNEGKLYIDYTYDLFHALKDFDHHYEAGDDIRGILAEHYPFLPAYSLPYTISEGEPTFN